jgi:BirA family biotin operon repressor/biotin-[acetyl-CoA-carboxylase] ligase
MSTDPPLRHEDTKKDILRICVLSGYWISKECASLLKYQIEYIESVDSTNDYLKQTAESGQARSGAVVVADYQTAGRGRLGRSWISQPGEALLFSLLTRSTLPGDKLALVSLLAGLSLRVGLMKYLDAIGQQKTSAGINLKWPNDILFERRKLCGILCESAHSSTEGAMVVIGSGLNVNQRESDFPPDLRTPAISLYSITGQIATPRTVLPYILDGLGEMLTRLRSTGAGWIVPEWEEKSDFIGQLITVNDAGRDVRGQVRGLAPDGALILEEENGETIVIHSGDVAVA